MQWYILILGFQIFYYDDFFRRNILKNLTIFQVHLYVVNKRSGEVLNTEYQCQPFFFFHTINTFEKSRWHSSTSSSTTNSNQADIDADSIVVDLLAYKDSEVNYMTISRLQLYMLYKSIKLLLNYVNRYLLYLKNVSCNLYSFFYQWHHINVYSLIWPN